MATRIGKEFGKNHFEKDMKRMTRESWDTPSPTITQISYHQIYQTINFSFFFQDLDDEMFNQGFLKHFLPVSGGYLDEFPWNRDSCLATLGHWNQDAKNSSIIFATVDACWEHG